MKYIITENQLKTLRKYMKTFINEDVEDNEDVVELPPQYNVKPFSELPEKGSIDRVQGWGIVQVPIGGDSLRTMKSKRDLIEFINSFKKQYNEEPKFKINKNEVWSKKITITNPKFQKDKEADIRYKASELDRGREKGWSID
jgi:hypothetical protein